MKVNTSYKDIIYLWKYLGKKRRYQFFLLLLLMVFSVFADILSVGSIIPFLSALTNPDLLMKQEWFHPIIRILNIKSSSELLLPLTIGFIGASVLASLIKVALLWFNSKLSASMGVELKTEVYKKTLYQPYEYHIANNSSQLISLVTEKVGRAIFAGVLHLLLMVSAAISSIAIIVTLIIINPMVALLAFLILGGGYVVIGSLVKKKISQNGVILNMYQPEAVKCMQEGLGGIRDIIIENNQDIFIDTYRKTAYKIEQANMQNSFLGNLPKSLIEVLSITLIAILAYYLQVVKGQQQVLPILGALALGAQKLLPSLQQIYFSWSVVNGSLPIIHEVVEQLDKETPSINHSKKDNILSFNNSINLKSINFNYNGSDTGVLNNLNLTINKGSKVGFIGKTGSGKSTLLDIIMGLLVPKSGYLQVDDTIIDRNNINRWQKHIAHVPQAIFLSDATIAENIAFGVQKDKIDMDRVLEAAKQASLDSFVRELPQKYDTFVGERGVQLSGGQRQRIGIARALYKKANVIVFDEATSALDDDTEKSVMESINRLSDDLTILMIAHRLTTLQECDVIYRLDKGKIVDSGIYDEIIKSNHHSKEA